MQDLWMVNHVGIKYHALQETLMNKTISLHFTPSADNKEDGLTKVLTAEMFSKHHKGISMIHECVRQSYAGLVVQ